MDKRKPSSLHQKTAHSVTAKKHRRTVQWSVLSGIFAVLVIGAMTHAIIVQKRTQAAVGDAGNIKVTVTREGDNAAVTDGRFSFWCDTGTQISNLTDNGARDLNSQAGVFEITPTAQEKTDSTCTSAGKTLYVQYDSSAGTYVSFTASTSYQTDRVNALALIVQFPLSVNVQDEFNNLITQATARFNGAIPTLTSGSAMYWAIPPAAGALAIQKTGYLPAESTNTGLSSVSVNTTAQTFIQLGSYAIRSSAIPAGGTAVQLKGLVPNIKFVVINPDDLPHNIDALSTFQKSTNNGTSYTAFTPLDISDVDYIAYDAADPQYTQTKYRILITNEAEVVLGPVLPSASSQQTINVRLPFTKGLANSDAFRVSKEVVITLPVVEEPKLKPGENPVTPLIPIEPKVPPPPKDPTQPPAPWKPTLLAPTVISSISIQWNLPLDIPEKLLPANANLSKVEGEGKSKKLTLLKSKVVTKNTTADPFILEEGLEPGKLYNDRVLTIDGVEGNFLFPAVSTSAAPIVENKPAVLPKPNDVPKTQLMAIKEANRGLYLQADGTFDKIAEWRPWYQWGFAQKLADGSLDLTKRILYIAQDAPEGNYKFEQYTKTTEDGPVQTNTLIEIHYIPPIKKEPQKT